MSNTKNDKPRTSKEWWDETKACPTKLISWLKDQYHGEVTAASRIRDIFFSLDLTEKEKRILDLTIRDELLHAEWVAELLNSRGVLAEELDKESRYWKKVLTEEVYTKEQAAAIGYHAEAMRLSRIRAIIEDEDSPPDILAVFKKILPMEESHVKRFSRLSNKDAISLMEGAHSEGLNALGLVI